MLTIKSGDIKVDIIDPCVHAEPSLLTDAGWVRTASAIVRIHVGDEVLHEWVETDVDSILRKMFDGDTFETDDALVDFFFSDSDRHVHVLNVLGEARVAATTSEDQYMAAVETARYTYLLWRDCQPELAADDRP